MNFLVAQVLFFFLSTLQMVRLIEVPVYPEIQEISHVKKPIIPILKHSFDFHKDGYQFSYETGNGIQAQESGYIKNKGDKKHETLVQQGTVTYHDEHGNPITLTYIADENGFQPQGDHLPTPPPIPEEIQKVIDAQQHIQEEPEYQQHLAVEYEHEQPQVYAPQYTEH